MADRKLGDLTVGVQVDTKGLKTGLTGAEGDVNKSAGKMGGAFQRMGGKIQGAAGKVPIIGSSLAQLVTPAGLATAAIGAVTAAIAGSISKVTSLEQELRPMIARSGLTAESLQVLSEAARQLGSEDGLDGVTDGAQELQLRLAEAVQDGTGPAVAAFEKLGLSAQDLINSSPEESLLATITALQGVTNEADRKFLADELMGGASERLSGVLSVNSAEFQALTKNIKENGDIVSNQGVASAKVLNLSMGTLKDSVGSMASELGVALMPAITAMVGAFQAAMPLLKALLDFVLPPLVNILGIFASSLKFVAAVLTGDWQGAWTAAKDIAVGAINTLVDVYNSTLAKLPGMPEIDASKLTASLATAEDAMEDTGTAATDMATEAGTAATSFGTAMTKVKENVEEVVVPVQNAFAAIVEANRASVTRAEELNTRRGELRAERDAARKAADDAEILALAEHDRVNKEARVTALAERRTAQKTHQENVKKDTDLALDALKILEADKWKERVTQTGTAYTDAITALKTHYGDATAEDTTAYDAAKIALGTAHDERLTVIKEKHVLEIDEFKAHRADEILKFKDAKPEVIAALNTAYDEKLLAIQGKHALEITEFDEHHTDILTDYGTFQDDLKTATKTRMGELQIETGLGLTAIEGMYAATGLAITTSWSDMMGALTGQVDQFITGVSGQGYTPGIFSNTTDGPFASAYDADGNYVGFVNGTHDITGRDPDGNKTGTNASDRESLGLAPVGDRPPGLPGLPSPPSSRPPTGGPPGRGGFHAGGIFRNPTRGLIAEAGPEVVIPLSQLTSVVRRATEGMGMQGNNNGGGVQVIVSDGAYVFDKFVDMTVRAIQDARLAGRAV